mmetsp:Transcript_1425/g.2689  ORF Transcript_1425/g.2689 Transcript_1425/m.2689 type:complete len:127 (-) Transcript_1425:486-866(-)
MTMAANVDPKLDYVPAALLNWISKYIFIIAIKMLNRKAKNLAGSEHEKRMKQDREFYGWLEGKVSDYLCKHGDKLPEDTAEALPESEPAGQEIVMAAVEELEGSLNESELERLAAGEAKMELEQAP